MMVTWVVYTPLLRTQFKIHGATKTDILVEVEYELIEENDFKAQYQ